MTFQDDNGNSLNLSDRFAMTKQAVSFFDSTIRGDVSINFKVDNNSTNRKTLGYFGPSMSSQIAWTKQPFNRMIGGNVLDRGYIVIQDEEPYYLDCFYVSGNSNWIQLLNGLITELDYTGLVGNKNYITQITNTNILTQPISGIIFPMVDWVYQFNKGSNYFAAANIFDISGIKDSSFMEWYPCFYLSSLVREIFSQNGLKLIGDIVNDPLFKSIVLTPSAGEIKRQTYNTTRANGTSQGGLASATVNYTSLTPVSDSEGLLGSIFAGAAYGYTANKYALVEVTIEMVEFTGGFAAACTINVYKYTLSTNSQSIVYSVVNNNAGSPIFIPFYTEVAMAPGDYIYISITGGPTANSITLNLKVTIPDKVRINDYVNPAFFLPAIASIDVVKYLIGRWGCVTYFDEASKTITINILDNIKREAALDWSNYYISHRNEYTVQSAKNNYFRMTPNSDKDIKKYNDVNSIGYGEGDVMTTNTLKDSNDFFKDIFSASAFKLAKNNEWITSIPLVNLKDNAAIPYNATGGDGGGNQTYAFTDGVTTLKVGECVRIVDSNSNDMGFFFVISLPGAGQFTASQTYVAGRTASGNVYRQSVTYYQTACRELIVKPSTNIADFSNDTSYALYSSTFVTSSQTPTAFAAFSKQKTGKGIDQFKGNLAFDNVNSSGFTDPTIKELYFNKISNILNDPTARCQMLLPQSVFQSFDFSNFVYLKTKDLTGYFFVQSIVNYQDSNIPVEVNLYMLN